MYYCARCKTLDEKLDARSHRCAINTAINTDEVAINKRPEEKREARPSRDEVQQKQEGKTANRRAMEDYNQYMKEYMRKRREGSKPTKAG